MLGMKDPSIQPILRCVLPSGLIVYESRFTDIYSSNLIFGGTHTSCSSKSGQINNIILHLNSLANIRSMDPYSKLEVAFVNISRQANTKNFLEFACKMLLPPKTCKEQLDKLMELDSDPLITYRCSNCRNCDE